jgi:hypothetical protein
MFNLNKEAFLCMLGSLCLSSFFVDHPSQCAAQFSRARLLSTSLRLWRRRFLARTAIHFHARRSLARAWSHWRSVAVRIRTVLRPLALKHCLRRMMQRWRNALVAQRLAAKVRAFALMVRGRGGSGSGSSNGNSSGLSAGGLRVNVSGLIAGGQGPVSSRGKGSSRGSSGEGMRVADRLRQWHVVAARWAPLTRIERGTQHMSASLR